MNINKDRHNAIAALENQFLVTSGWLRSIGEGKAVDAHGPVPWFTYPATRFFERIIRPEYRVLEYGSGNSSRWWSRRVKEVVSVEHDPEWADALRRERIQNLTVVERVMHDMPGPACDKLLREEYFPCSAFGVTSPDPTRNYRAGLLDGEYAAYAAVGLEYPAGHFDVIVVDGMARVLTAWIAARQVADSGIIIFDNSDRAEYEAGYQLLRKAGFQRIDFWGLGPINPYEWCTSLFLKSLKSLERIAA